jgi:recombination associated protein RdgC
VAQFGIFNLVRNPVFKNLIVYRIGPDWSATASLMEEALDATRFTPCSATQEKAVGWIEPRGVAHGPLVEAVAGQYMLKYQIETKAVPGSVVRRKVDELVAQIEASTGRKPGKKETKELREDALQQLLPQAFVRQQAVLIWIDPTARLLVVDASSQAKADEVTTALVSALPGLHVALLQTQVSPQAAMTAWLTATTPDEWPAGLSVERECELKGGEPDKSVVKFTRHSLLNDEIRLHISQGKLPSKLALSWEGRVGLVLTEGLQLKKISFLEGVFDGPDAGKGNKDERFDTDVAISTGELGKLLLDLTAALGGEVVRS